MSTFKCPVVRITRFAKNPNSDSLMIWNGPQGPLQFKEGQFKEGDLAVFVPADSLVPVCDGRFSYLDQGDGKERFRVRGIKLRGVPSVGLLVPCPDGLLEGQDAAQALDVQKYVPPQTHSFGTDSNAAKAPEGAKQIPVYDVENIWNLEHGVVEGGMNGVACTAMDFHANWAITEKIHGCNFKCLMDDEGYVHIGSRSRWVQDDGTNVWSVAYRKHKEKLDAMMKNNPNTVFFGEVFGKVQDLKYGLDNDVDLRLFDMLNTENNRFHPQTKLVAEMMKVPDALSLLVPVLGPAIRGTLREAIERAKDLACGKSTLHKDTIREGVVVRPVGDERMVFGKDVCRLMTKVISPEYLSRKNGTEYQ